MIWLYNTTGVGGDLGPASVESGDLMSLNSRQVFEVANYVFLCGIMSVFGIGSNSVNIVVFCKQGFQTSTNISFLALTISDLCCLIILVWFGICMNPLLPTAGFPLVTKEIHSLTGGWPHVIFSRITSWITAYITAERCLCITIPLQVKRIITPRRTVYILVCIYIFNFITVSPVYVTSRFEWKFYSEQNTTLLGAVIFQNNAWVESQVFLTHATLTLAAVFSVIILTSVLVIRFNMTLKWRHSATQVPGERSSLSSKEKKTTRMVIMISSLLIAMYSPGVIFSLVTFCEPKIGVFGAYRNLFMTLWSFGFFFNSVNSSMNIFLYYTMSSKYRQTLNQIFQLAAGTAGTVPVSAGKL